MTKKWAIILLICCSGALHGQSLLEQRVTITCEDMAIEQALYLLIDQEGVALSFSNRIIPPDKRINCQFLDFPVEDVLRFMLDGTDVIFEEVEGQIILFRSPKALRKYTVSGYIRDAQSHENIISAIVHEADRLLGTYTNEYGYYSLTFSEGPARLAFSALGYETVEIAFDHTNDRRLDLYLNQAYLRPVIVRFFNDTAFVMKAADAYHLNIDQLGRMTSLGGEADLVRSAFNLPGIQTGADGFGGLAVRGGDIDQNLFLLDGVPVYNAMHGLGLFSIYNTSAVRSAKVLKGAFPARYGGRMSSVWDVRTKEGDQEKTKGEVDVGITSVKLTIEGPLKQNQSSFFFSGRRALFDFYSEPISRRLRGNDGFVSYHFSDLNLKLNHEFSKNDRLYFSFYQGSDVFFDKRVLRRTVDGTSSSFTDTDEADWGNVIAALRHNHIFSEKLFANTTLTFSQYLYGSQDLVDLEVGSPNEVFSRDVFLQVYQSSIKDFALKTDFDYTKFERSKWRFGGQATRHEFFAKITSFEEAQTIDSIDRDTIGDASNQPVFANEVEVYAENEIGISEKWEANLGMRVSASSVLGKWFVLPQPRISLQFQPKSNTVFELSANRMTQFLHLLSPSRLGLPKDLWVTSTSVAPPQDSWQFELGMGQKFKKGFSVEVDFYLKQFRNQLYFKSAVEEINTLNWQEKVAVGNGRSVGAEFMLQKQGEKWGGWLAYTLGRSTRQFPGINEGERFPIKLDRRHNLNLQFTMKLNQHWDFSSGFVIASGAFYSLPTQEYSVVQMEGLPAQINRIPIPEGVNDRRLASYHRLDFSTTYQWRSGKVRHSIQLGVSNAYNRLNPLFRTLRAQHDESGNLTQQFVEVSLLPIFPSLRYNLLLE